MRTFARVPRRESVNDSGLSAMAISAYATILNMNTCLFLIYRLVCCASYETKVADVGMHTYVHTLTCISDVR